MFVKVRGYVDGGKKFFISSKATNMLGRLGGIEVDVFGFNP